jgi:16S rRNA (adenine1518-N6/adenine1519-N6)-dimethyltransferase
VASLILYFWVFYITFARNFRKSMKVTPKKALGQHFLKDLNIAQRIAETIDVGGGMPVLEIGPGMGVLTQFLLQNKEIDLTCVELDSESVTYLLANFPELNGRIIEGDFLKMNLNEMYKGQFCVIGNFPYNISSQIFFKVLDHKDKIPICAGMIQKEVAERMASKPGTKAYGILSVLVQAYYDIEYLFTVHENVFDPPPKVKSAVIRMRRNETKKIDCDEDLFVKVVKTAFNQRRKMMRNSLQAMLGQGHPLLADPVFMKRPEQLSVSEFVDLTNLIAKNISV